MASPLKPIFVIGVLLMIMGAPIHGQDKPASGEQSCELRTFRVLAEALYDEPAKKLPAASADSAAWDQAIAGSTEVWVKLMSAQGIVLGKEAKVLYDPEWETLSIYANAEAIQLAEAYTEQLCSGVPRHITFTLEVLEGPGATVRALTAKAQSLPSHVAMLRDFEALVARNEAKHLGTLRLESRSGQRSTAQSGPEQNFPRAFIRNEPGAVTARTETRPVGIKLELEPIIGPDGLTMDLSYSLEVHSAPPQLREVPSPPLGDSQARKLPVFDFCLANLTSAITYNGDDTKLLGVWTPCEANGQPRHEVLQAAFLRMAPVALVRELNPLVETKLREHLLRQGHIAAVDAELVAELALPVGKGMKRQEFKVPHDFLTHVHWGTTEDDQRVLFLDSPAICIPVQPDPTSPFAPGNESPPVQPEGIPVRRDIPLVPASTPLEWIVPLPEGTSHRYHPDKDLLEVVHTEKGLRQIEALINLTWTTTPALLSFSLHIVQADGATLRELTKDNATHSDHTGAWGKVEELARNGKATVLSTQRLETRSGQRAKLSVGLERATVDAFENTDRGTIEAKTSSKTVGTIWEFEPILSPDRRTIDANLALEFHFAPLQPSPSEATPTPGVGLDAEKVFASKVVSAYTLRSGTTRLIGLWKPSGTPELDGKDVLQAAFLRADVVPVASREHP